MRYAKGKNVHTSDMRVEQMKKAFVLVALWLCVLSGGVAAGTARHSVHDPF